MGDVVALPAAGAATAASLPDARGGHRALQVTWHDDDGVVVVSSWRHGRCVASVRLTADEAAALIGTLAHGLARRAEPVVRPGATVTPVAPRRSATGVAHRRTPPPVVPPSAPGREDLTDADARSGGTWAPPA
ncbi:hypothetical protein GXB85_10715 [Cellulomonas sp. APG4]|uniref:hypothetical protein n=1 Tax=Cellulomonas sp. APG4 TaxID=1538656 RepID=UPI001379F19E|nr:hypothetical protein [Cellulomonas sp. APG4]NCT91421.1 hypothetical protein [Cellulomonas sp. APG4]